MEPRPFQTGRDWEAMMQLLIAGRRANNGTYYAHTGDVRWWLFYPNQEPEFSQRIFLWEQEGRLRGWCLITPEQNCYDLFVHPSLRGGSEAEAMSRWSEAKTEAVVRAAGGNHIAAFWIAESDTVRKEDLARRGFRQGAEMFHYFRRAIGSPPAPQLPEGFAIRSVQSEADAQLRAAASQAAFGYKRPWDEYWPRYQSFVRSRVYEAERDMMLVAPDGRCASFCVYWLDEVNKVGLFEPVGTHPDFQGRGLGKALLAETLRRMKARGMETAIVCADHDNPGANRLYESVGFTRADRLLLFEKEL